MGIAAIGHHLLLGAFQLLPQNLHAFLRQWIFSWLYHHANLYCLFYPIAYSYLSITDCCKSLLTTIHYKMNYDCYALYNCFTAAFIAHALFHAQYMHGTLPCIFHAWQGTIDTKIRSNSTHSLIALYQFDSIAKTHQNDICNHILFL